MSTCTYRGSVTDPPDPAGVCTAQLDVAEGCPIYVVALVGASIEPQLGRGAMQIDVTPSVTMVDTSEELFHTKDVYSCDCRATSIPTAFGRYSITIPKRARATP